MAEACTSKRGIDLLMSTLEVEDHVDVWIAVIGDKIVAEGDNAKDVYKKAKDLYPDKEPFIAKLPKNRVMLL